MAGIEANPGPPKQNMGDLARSMDEILTELKDTRTALSLKLDNAVKDLSIKLQVCEQQLVNQTTRLDNADLQRATMQAEIDSLKTQVFNLQSTPTLAAAAATTPVTPPLTVNDVAHELQLRTSKGNKHNYFWYSPVYHFIRRSDCDQLTARRTKCNCHGYALLETGKTQHCPTSASTCYSCSCFRCHESHSSF